MVYFQWVFWNVSRVYSVKSSLHLFCLKLIKKVIISVFVDWDSEVLVQISLFQRVVADLILTSALLFLAFGPLFLKILQYFVKLVVIFFEDATDNAVESLSTFDSVFRKRL